MITMLTNANADHPTKPGKHLNRWISLFLPDDRRFVYKLTFIFIYLSKDLHLTLTLH